MLLAIPNDQCARFPHSCHCSTHLQCSKVDDIVNVGVRLEDLVQLLLVGNVRRVVLRPLAADELNAVEHLLGGVVEVVNDDDLVVGLEESKSSERADVAGATGNILVLAARTMTLLLLVGTLSRGVALMRKRVEDEH